MNIDLEEFNPDYLVSPGEILEETLEARGIKKKDFADRCGKTAKTISEIIAGKAPITPETALQFERVLGVSARLWSNLESSYRLKLAEQEDQKKLQLHHDLSKKFPINELVKFGFINKPKDSIEALSRLLHFFGVGAVDALDHLSSSEVALYRNSKSFEGNKYAISTWLRCGQIRAETIETRPYSSERFKESLVRIRSLTREEDIEFSLSKCVELCAEAGIALVLVPELKGTRLCGASRWLSKDKALIQLSLRHKSDDQLWFTFFHEAGHILLHGKKDLFIDEVDQDKDHYEQEADAFAQNTLIPKDSWSKLIGWADFPEKIIKDFAYEQGISPGIVVGMLQYKEKYLSHAAKQNSLKVRYEWDAAGTKISRKEMH